MYSYDDYTMLRLGLGRWSGHEAPEVKKYTIRRRRDRPSAPRLLRHLKARLLSRRIPLRD